MHILLLGGGGREHALAWKISQSKKCTALFIGPGNAGTSAFGKNLPLDPTDFSAVGKACLDNSISMVLVGPEEPLVKGIVDYFLNDGSLSHIPVIGPNASAARLEGSKAFSKQFMIKHGIPTAAYREFDADHFSEGSEYVKTHSLPVVLKADGLAAGKGVIICQSHIEAVAEFELMLQQDKFGEAGRRIVVEEFLDGIGQFGHFPRGLAFAGVAGTPHLAQAVAVFESGPGLFQVEIPFGIHQCLGFFLPDAHHLCGLFRERHPGQKVLDSLFGRPF